MKFTTTLLKSTQLSALALVTSLTLSGYAWANATAVTTGTTTTSAGSTSSALLSGKLQGNGSFLVSRSGHVIKVLDAATMSSLEMPADRLSLLLGNLPPKHVVDSNGWAELLRDMSGHYQTLRSAVDDIQVAGDALKALKVEAKRAVEEVDLDQAAIMLNEIRSESLRASPALTLVAAEADAANATRALAQQSKEEAADYFLRASSAMESLGEKHHVKWSLYADKSGSAFRETGYYAEANALLSTAFELREKHAPGSLLMLESMNKLAQIKRLMAEYDSALPLYKRALAYNEESFGANDTRVAVALNNVADVYRLSNKFDEALPLYQRALGINRDQLGNDHPDFATTLNNLAGLYESTGAFEEALALYQEALQVNERIHGRNHPAVATTLNNLAGLYRALGQFNTALPLYERDLAISRQALGNEHPDVATTLNNLGILYFYMEDYRQSAIHLEQALHIFKSKLGKEHPNTKRVEESLEVIKQNLK